MTPLLTLVSRIMQRRSASCERNLDSCLRNQVHSRGSSQWNSNIDGRDNQYRIATALAAPGRYIGTGMEDHMQPRRYLGTLCIIRNFPYAQITCQPTDCFVFTFLSLYVYHNHITVQRCFVNDMEDINSKWITWYGICRATIKFCSATTPQSSVSIRISSQVRPFLGTRFHVWSWRTSFLKAFKTEMVRFYRLPCREWY